MSDIEAKLIQLSSDLQEQKQGRQIAFSVESLTQSLTSGNPLRIDRVVLPKDSAFPDVPEIVSYIVVIP